MPSTLAVRSLKSNPEIKSIFRRSKSGVQNGTSQGILLRPLQPDLPVQGGQVIPSPSGMVTKAMFFSSFFFISEKLAEGEEAMTHKTTKKRRDYANFVPDPKAKSGSVQKRVLGQCMSNIII